MQGHLLKSLQIPIYPWLAGAYPILHLYSVNFGLVVDREVPIALLWVLAATTICYIAIYAAIRNGHLTAMITTTISLCFSLSGHVYKLIAERESPLVWSLTVVILAAIAVSELLKIRNVRLLEQFTLPLNLITSSMILMQAITLFAHYSDTFANPLQSVNSWKARLPPRRPSRKSMIPALCLTFTSSFQTDTLATHGSKAQCTLTTPSSRKRCRRAVSSSLLTRKATTGGHYPLWQHC